MAVRMTAAEVKALGLRETADGLVDAAAAELARLRGEWPEGAAVLLSVAPGVQWTGRLGFVVAVDLDDTVIRERGTGRLWRGRTDCLLHCDTSAGLWRVLREVPRAGSGCLVEVKRRAVDNSGRR